MVNSRRPSWPALLFVLPGLLSSPASAHSLTGFAPASRSAFPSTQGMFEAFPDPLSTLALAGDDLRDSLNALSPADALKIGLRDASVAARLAAVSAAAFPRDVAAVPSLAGVMLRLDQPSRLRVAAALALGRIGDRVAVPALVEALKDPLPDVRFAAALSLGRLPADGVVTRLERTLRSDPAWGPRYAAAIALGRARKAFGAGALAEALASDPAWQVRQQAARSLADLGTAHAAQALTSALNDPEPSVRAAAGAGLAEIGAPEQRRAAARARREEKDPSVRAVLAVSERP